jgi:hypothetical protein
MVVLEAVAWLVFLLMALVFVVHCTLSDFDMCPVVVTSWHPATEINCWAALVLSLNAASTHTHVHGVQRHRWLGEVDTGKALGSAHESGTQADTGVGDM